jgi:dephospho-CoA kinase
MQTFVIGITGGIASGKSTISNIIRSLGFVVVDADIAAREVVMPGEPAYQKIIETFGEEILLENKEINRAKLGSIIFHNEEKRLILNSIVHPAVRQKMLADKDAAIERGEKTVFMDIPLLFESKLTYMVDRTILVYVDENTQLKRLIERNQLSKEEALARIQSQMPLSEKKALADAVIDNNGTIDQSKEQLLEILRQWGVLQ